MAPPPQKRAIFSLNVDSSAEHIYERVEDRNKEGPNRVKIRENREPLVRSSKIELLTKPFEKEVQRSVEKIVGGRVVRDTKVTRENSQARSRKREKREKIEEKYDISDL